MTEADGLTDRQIADYDRDGYLVLKDLFSDQEVALLQRDAEMPRTATRPSQQRVGRTAPAFARPGVEIGRRLAAAYRLPRVLEP